MMVGKNELFTGPAHEHGAKRHDFKDQKHRDRIESCLDVISEHCSLASEAVGGGISLMYDKKPETLTDLVLATQGLPPQGAKVIGYVSCPACLTLAISQLKEATAALEDLQKLLADNK
jgi:hypothetical protein